MTAKWVYFIMDLDDGGLVFERVLVRRDISLTKMAKGARFIYAQRIVNLLGFSLYMVEGEFAEPNMLVPFTMPKGART